MKYEWDENKNIANVEKHGIGFACAHELFEGNRLIFPDDRKDYGEPRFIIAGYIENRMMVAVYTQRSFEQSGLFPYERRTVVKKHDLKKQSETDWARIDAMKDEDIDYSDIPELDDEFFEKAVLVPAKKLVTMRLDADVVAWLKRNGRGYQTRANKILRSVMESQEKSAKKRIGGAT